MNPTLAGVAETLEDFIASRREEIDKAERMLHVLRHGPAPEQAELFDLHLVEGSA